MFRVRPPAIDRYLFAVLETITQFRLRKPRSVLKFYTTICPPLWKWQQLLRIQNYPIINKCLKCICVIHHCL
jgi:hypothetical protein